MPFCPRCGKEVLPTDRFCLNCGQDLQRPAASTVQVQPSALPASSPTKSKSPAGAAILNFLFPGTGYIYNGIGTDTGELIFGALVFVFYFLGFEVGIVLIGLTTPRSTVSVPYSPYEALILLVYLLPFAFAYDAYRRAKFA